MSIVTVTQVPVDMIVRRALYDRLPGSAFVVKDGVDWIRVGYHWLEFQKLCEGIAADLSNGTAR